MKRKGLVRLLSIVTALMLPLSAMAQSAAMDLLKQAKTDGKEIVATVTFEPGAALAADQVVADLSAATAIRINKLAGGYGAFTLVLSGVDTVAAQLHVQADGLYVQSETLGTKPLFFSWEDLQKTMQNAMQSSGSSADMAGFQQMMTTGMANIGAVEETEPLTEEQIKQKITQAMGGDDSFVKWMEAIQARKVVTKGDYTIEGSDAADTKTEITVTKEDMASLYDVPYIQKQITAQLKSQDSTLTDEQATAKTKETIDQIKAELIKSNAVMPMVFYSIGEDNLVAADIKMTATLKKVSSDAMDTAATVTTDTAVVAADAAATADTATAAAEATATPAVEETAKYDVSLVLTKKTADTGKIYAMTMYTNEDDKKVFGMSGNLAFNDKVATGTLTAVDGEDQPKLLMDLTCDYTDAKKVNGELAATAFDAKGDNAILLGFGQAVGDTTVDNALSVYYGTSVEEIKADTAKSLLGTVKLNITVKDDSGYFAALKEATPATSLEVMKLSAEELQTYLGTLQGNAFQLLYKIMGNLPQSVSKLLNSAMSGT